MLSCFCKISYIFHDSKFSRCCWKKILTIACSLFLFRILLFSAIFDRFVSLCVGKVFHCALLGVYAQANASASFYYLLWVSFRFLTWCWNLLPNTFIFESCLWVKIVCCLSKLPIERNRFCFFLFWRTYVFSLTPMKCYFYCMVNLNLGKRGCPEFKIVFSGL